jgi:hypothetical protein
MSKGAEPIKPRKEFENLFSTGKLVRIVLCVLYPGNLICLKYGIPHRVLKILSTVSIEFIKFSLLLSLCICSVPSISCMLFRGVSFISLHTLIGLVQFRDLLLFN